MERDPDAVKHGYNFQEQWKRVFELDPPFVMVTGWNEWIAGRWGEPGGPLVFVDQFDQANSRDIEPMKGGHGDNYYWQLIANVRRYKGTPTMPTASPPKTIRLKQSFDQWADVGPEYADHVGETIVRDHSGAAGLRYTNHTGRNDFTVCKVARDTRNVHFYVRTQDAISPASDTNWMWLLIDADQNPKTGWEGFDFLVNRSRQSDGKTSLEKNEGGWKWEQVASVVFRVEGNQLHLTVPRRMLGPAKRGSKVSFDFKWADNLQQTRDIMDFYVSGDVAPEGRFNYRFKE